MTDRAAPTNIARSRIEFTEIPLWVSIAIAVLLAFALTAPTVEAVWRVGQFFDTDDAMRAVQVRDLLAGQPWYDMTAYRLDPPGGMFSHWSRVVDTPIAALELFFRLFLSPEYAERSARLLFPALLLVAILRLAAWCAEMLCDACARHAAVWAVFLTGAMFMQFLPGRIDHHAPQIVLLMTTLCFFLAGLRQARAMAPAAAAMAASIAISLENLPFFAVIAAALPALFILDGARLRSQLLWFAGGALVSFPLFYAATVGPSRYLLSACDAFSAVHLAVATIGAVSLILFAVFTPLLSTPARRMGACALAGAAVLAGIASISRQCFAGPFVELDPLLRELWLANVREAQPLSALWREQQGGALAIAAPVLAGLAVALYFSFSEKGLARRRWAIMSAVIAIGFTASLWQVRVFTSVAPIAAVAGAIGAVALANRFAAEFGKWTRALLTACLCLASSPMGLALALPRTPGDPSAEPFACYDKSALEPLNNFAPARIAAPIEMGAFILASTPHSVYAAPYHRDNHGNRLVVDAFLAEPARAEEILRAAGADLVVWCSAQARNAPLSRRSDASLAARLSRGAPPDWLEPKGPSGGAVHVFALRPKE
jgi:hypothetical protein